MLMRSMNSFSASLLASCIVSATVCASFARIFRRCSDSRASLSWSEERWRRVCVEASSDDACWRSRWRRAISSAERFCSSSSALCTSFARAWKSFSEARIFSRSLPTVCARASAACAASCCFANSRWSSFSRRRASRCVSEACCVAAPSCTSALPSRVIACCSWNSASLSCFARCATSPWRSCERLSRYTSACSPDASTTFFSRSVLRFITCSCACASCARLSCSSFSAVWAWRWASCSAIVNSSIWSSITM
mmetsp:Transcript_17683/g.42637  ORF Transcript_17683/g.42637 Transcript_17683/m.42637 type:complete len:252 (-) Transcript_17683:6-761(-)